MEGSESHRPPLDKKKMNGIISSLYIDLIFGFDRSSRCQDIVRLCSFELKRVLKRFRKSGKLRRELKSDLKRDFDREVRSEEALF